MNIKQLNERLEKVLNEAKPMRAWNGKLSHITDFIDYLTEHDFLTKAEKNKKESLYHRYYRWYNDGDIPRGLKTPTNKMEVQYGGKRVQDRVDKELEEMLEEFLKQILSKYLPKVDRKEFRKSVALKEINEILYHLRRNNLNYILYLAKDLKNTDERIQEKLDDLNELYEKYKNVAKNVTYPKDDSRTVDTIDFTYGYATVEESSKEGRQVVDDIIKTMRDLTVIYAELKDGLTQIESLNESINIYGEPGDNLNLHFNLVKEDETGKTWSLEGIEFVQTVDEDSETAAEDLETDIGQCLYDHFFPVWKKNGVEEFDMAPLDYLEGDNEGWVYVDLI